MKKAFCLLLALVMVLGLAACGSEPESPSRVETAPAQLSAEALTEATTEASAEKDEHLLGVFDGSTYVNEFLGIQCQLDENWTIATDEELGQLSGLTADAITDEAIAEQLRNSGIAYALYATADEGLVTMNIVFENLGLLYGTVLDEETYASLSVEQLATALESTGLENVTAETTTVSFAGADHAAIMVHASVSGVDFYEQLVCMKVKSYIAVVTVGSFQEDITSDLLAMYTPLSV